MRKALHRLREYLANGEYLQLVRNFFSLSVLNLLNFVLPLVTLPYLVHVLGPEKYGLTVFALAVINYGTLIVNYGFNFSATRRISIARHDTRRVSVIFSSIIFIRLLLTAACGLVLLFVLWLPTGVVSDPVLYLYTFGVTAGAALVPVWLYQGMEQMKYITLVNSIPRILFTLLVFVFIRRESDYLYVNLLNSIGAVLAGVISIWISIRRFGIRLLLPRFADILEQLRDGWYVFVSTVFMNLYRESNGFLLGLLTNYTVVGYYSAAERIMKACQSLFYPVSETLFPFMSKTFSGRTMRENKRKLFRIMKYYAGVLGVLAGLLYFAADFVIGRFLSSMHPMAVADLRILSFVILFGGLNYLLGIIGLVNLGMSRQFTASVVVAGVVSVAVCLLLAPVLLDKGASWAMFVSESVLLTMILFFLIRRK